MCFWFKPFEARFIFCFFYWPTNEFSYEKHLFWKLHIYSMFVKGPKSNFIMRLEELVISVPVVFEGKQNPKQITVDKRRILVILRAVFIWCRLLAQTTKHVFLITNSLAASAFFLWMSVDPLLERLALSSSQSRISLLKSKSCVFHMGLPDLLHAAFSLFLPFISTLLFSIFRKAPHFRQAMRDYDYFGKLEKNAEGEESVRFV